MKLFNKKAKVDNGKTIVRMLTEVGNGFYEWNGKLYQSDIVRACIKPKTKAIGKMMGKHIRTSVKADGTQDIQVNPSVNIRFLLEEPNAYMSWMVLQEKMANQLSLNGNAYALILRNEWGLPVGLYPIPCVSIEAKYTQDGDLTLRFRFRNGKWMDISYDDVIHIRDDMFFNDIFGESPQEALTQSMTSVSIMDQGIVKAIKNSAVIKWLLRFTQAIRDDDLKIKAKEFADNYLSISNEATGVAAINANVDAQQIEPKDYVPNAALVDRQTDRIYAFFNTNDRIVHSTYSENEWASYYAANVEPVVMQMAAEYTRKIFSRKERSCGNEIVFESSSLTYASLTTKLNLVQFVDRGILTPNEVRKYFNLTPIEGGDVALLRKDTGTLNGGEEDETGRN